MSHSLSVSNDWWCCIATNIDDENNDDAQTAARLVRVSGYTSQEPTASLTQELATKMAVAMTSSLPLVESRAASNETRKRNLDLTQAPDWMEYIEQLEGRQHQPGGAGAYDAMRCDLIYRVSATTPVYTGSHSTTEKCLTVTGQNDEQDSTFTSHVWGLDFHLQRIQQSYQSLFMKDLHPIGIEDVANAALPSNIQKATKNSKEILHALTEEAKQQLYTLTRINSLDTLCDKKNLEGSIHVVRLTLLWSPATKKEPLDLFCQDHSADIVVRGHACCCWKTPPFAPRSAIIPSVTCSLAMDAHIPSVSNSISTCGNINATANNTKRFMMPASLPTRYQDGTDPQVKMAAWTRLRQTMEEPKQYKPVGVSEVLMVRPFNKMSSTCSSKSNDDTIALEKYQNDDWELLEGLSSNVFVIYRDGSLHTATTGVLHGYIRHLVLECVVNNSIDNSNTMSDITKTLTVDLSKPILLSEVAEWKEAFITSSSRLLYPIDRILLRVDHTDDSNRIVADQDDTSTVSHFEEFWRDPVLTDRPVVVNTVQSQTKNSVHCPKQQQWQGIYDKIVQQAGYF